MKAVIQRVKSARVEVDGQSVGQIGEGLLTFLGVGPNDDEEKLKTLIEKILKLRIFEDAQGKMNLSLLDIKGEHLIVSQFTLYADTRKGNRPSFTDAAPPELAESLYQKAIHLSEQAGIRTRCGKFRAHMKISMLNDGPVTIPIEIL